MCTASQPATLTCRSDLHVPPVPAVVNGTFDCGTLNGNPAEPDSAYCLRCAVVLHDIGYFTPTDGTTLPSVREFVEGLGDPT